MTDSNGSDIEALDTVESLADTLNVPCSWVYNQTRRRGPDAIPVLKVGKYCRFRRRDVMAWLEKRSRGRR